MAVTYRTTLKTTRMQAVSDDIDSAATPGTLEIGTAGMASVLATLTLADPCGTVTGDTLTLTVPLSDASADNAGTAAAARIKNGDGDVVVSGLTVGGPGSGANIELSSTTIAAGDAVTITSGTLQHA